MIAGGEPPRPAALARSEFRQPDADWAVAAALDVLVREYGLEPLEITRLGGEVDLNLAVTCADGRRVVVKLGRPDANLVQLKWQHDLLRGLHRDGSPIAGLPPVPEILTARDGSDVQVVAHGAGLHPVRVQTWVPGRTLAELDRHSPELLREWGRAAGRLVLALPTDPAPSGASRTHHWDALRAPEAIESVLWATTDPNRVAMVRRIVGWFDRIVTPVMSELPRQVVHQDLNDFNVLATADATGRYRLSGVLDFGDALHTARISELAIAMAYAMLRKPNPLDAAAQVMRGFCEVAPVLDAELRVLFPIAAARLCVNATTWTAREADNPDYARARMHHTWPTIAALADIAPSLAEAWFRETAGDTAPSPASLIERRFQAASARPDQPEVVAVSFAPTMHPVRRQTDAARPATIGLGAELRAGSSDLQLPLGGTVVLNDGATVVLRHDGEHPFWSRWTPLDSTIRAGDAVPAGHPLPARTSGVRLCLFAAEDAAMNAPDAVEWADVRAWRRLCPDPGLLYGVTMAAAAPTDPLPSRSAHFARSQRHYYDDPPTLLGSSDVWLHDDRGLAYLDAMNNVSHVGHANPAVVDAAHRQSMKLNTNSRFVYDGIGQYAARLTDLLPDPLQVAFLVCTGSEANDLALRIARQVTGRDDVVVIDGAYHGNTAATTAVSPNRYRGPGGRGVPQRTHEAIQPNRYRGPFGYADSDAGARYAADVARVVDGLVAHGRAPAAFIAESLMGTAGTIVHPPGYLAASFEAVRGSGGLCISDEVQVGFGRLGVAFWGFEAQGVVPDIVTMGKPIGNGHPLAAVVTTRAIADAFDTGMKYFNTFGGNPVSCAVGMAVLDEIEKHSLQARARDVGDYLLGELRALAERQPILGDVRGDGLYLGIELVRDQMTKEPAGDEARYISERMKDEGVLTYPSGAYSNVLKIKPPMTFSRRHADLFVSVLGQILDSDW